MAAPSSSLVSMVAQLQHVQMTFDGFASLSLTDINLEIGRGEIFGLIGPEGSGKSTILMLLAGRLRPADGKVKVFGRSPRRSSIRARIGYLPQHSRRANRAGLSGLLARSLRKLRPGADQPFPVVPLSLRLDQLLLKKPELLLLDEPFTGLDAAAVQEMWSRMAALARQGQTIILSSRWLSPAKNGCGRMAILFRGQMQAAGSLAQLLASRDAIRIVGPVLPPDSAEKVLTTMCEEMLEPAGLPERFADDAGIATEPSKPSNRAPNPETHENPIFAALTRPGPLPATECLPAESADAVNHEKLAQLTKPPQLHGCG
jgi:ABC-type multidrug transport system ATPase subunit